MYIQILFGLCLKDKSKNFHMYEYLFHPTVYVSDRSKYQGLLYRTI